jgi:3-hydroxybutyryl-CoA dehydratase
MHHSEKLTTASLTYDELSIGLTRSFQRLITEQDIDDFGRLSGDVSPLHSSDTYAASQTQYPKRLVHGMHLASLVSCLVGMHLPGFRSVCLSQSFDFIQPVYAGQEVEVRGEVASKQDPTRTIVLRTSVLADGVVCVKGKAIVRVLDSEFVPA